MAKMGAEFGIGELTMQRAFYKLRDEGWLVIRHGYNTRIANQLPSANAKERLLEQAKRAPRRGDQAPPGDRGYGLKP